jgi:hypothetical protein
MNQRTALLAVLIVAGVAVVAVPAAGFAPGAIGGSQGPVDDAADGEPDGRTATANASENATTPPGVQLTGVVGVQKAEIEGEVESRGFEIALNRSENASKQAAVVARQVTDLNASLERLRERKDELDRGRENGTITEGEYRARVAEVATRISTVRRLANQTANATRTIPADALRDRGVNATAIGKLRRDARNLRGPDVAAIARSIAGPGAGKGLGRGPPANRTGWGNGPPGEGQPGADAPVNDPPGTNESTGNGGPDTDRDGQSAPVDGAQSAGSPDSLVASLRR